MISFEPLWRGADAAEAAIRAAEDQLVAAMAYWDRTRAKKFWTQVHDRAIRRAMTEDD